MSDAKVWRAAEEMQKLYGADASFHAAQRADGFLDLGDPKGFRNWERVTKALQELERTTPAPGEKPH